MATSLIVACETQYPGGMQVAADFALPLDPPQTLILFGPSGSGKTTILRSLAGLTTPDRGTIRFGDEVWSDAAQGHFLPPQRRGIGYLAQDYALFPHLSVHENIAYGLTGPSAERARRVAELLDLFQLQGLGERKPAALSGGQQQRVGLARAVARRPKLLLLDEPLSALDAPVRASLQGELRRLLRQLAIPAVVVTHDWAEALALGDVLVVMNHGRVVQQGSPQSVFVKPVNQEVAHVVGVETVVPGRVVDASEGLATVEVMKTADDAVAPDTARVVQRLTAVSTEPVGTDVFVCVRAEDVTIQPHGPGVTSARNHVAGLVTQVQSAGAMARVVVDCGFPLVAMVTRSALIELQLQPGTPVRASIKAGAVHLVRR
ncbi:MAG: ABC transporter ATP-binding protein [Nitrospiraceae bacterium]